VSKACIGRLDIVRTTYVRPYARIVLVHELCAAYGVGENELAFGLVVRREPVAWRQQPAPGLPLTGSGKVVIDLGQRRIPVPLLCNSLYISEMLIRSSR